MASKTKRKNPGALASISQRLTELSRSVVRTGWSEETGASGETATIALFNTLGTPDTPARPVLAPLMLAARASIRTGTTQALIAATKGQDTAHALERLAGTLAGQGKALIRGMSSPANAASTEAQKGFNDPLVGAGADGGRLVASFGSYVADKGS